jgi:hypothetical protein
MEGLTHLSHKQETLNFWKQLSHVLKYFRAEEDPKARLPKTFIAGFLEVRLTSSLYAIRFPLPYLLHTPCCTPC